MFGYVIPDKNNMYIKDFNVFQAYYCGLCKALSRSGSQLSRLCTNYDTTFYNALLHSLTDTEVKIERKLCLINGKKKPVIVLMKESFRKLDILEKRNSAQLDLVADCFASLMRDVTRTLIPTDEHIDTFMYNLGRLVYFFDAADDVEKDAKKGRYNPLIAAYGKCDTKAEFLEKNAQELDFLLRSTYNKLVGAYNHMHIVVSEGMLSNTVYLGLNMQMERLLKGDDKCQVTRL